MHLVSKNQDFGPDGKLSLERMIELLSPEQQETGQFSVKLSGRYLALFKYLKQRIPGLGITTIVHDGLAVLGLLHSEDGQGKRPRVFVRFADSDGREQEKPLEQFVALASETKLATRE